MIGVIGIGVAGIGAGVLALAGAHLGIAGVAAAETSTEEGAAPDSTLAHTREEFDLTLPAAFDRVFPLFGGHGERAWSEGWDPRFLFPDPPADIPGAVFMVRHQDEEEPWITTEYDPAAGHIQHVYFVSGHMVTLIDIRFTVENSASTKVHVRYERTALCPAVNEMVSALGVRDSGRAPRWQQALEGSLRSRP